MFGKKKADEDIEVGTGYAYCEAVTATPFSPHHIRKLTDVGMKFGGGVDTPTLCGRDIHLSNGWDVAAVLPEDAVGLMTWSEPRTVMNDASWSACRPCVEAYLVDTGQ